MPPDPPDDVPSAPPMPGEAVPVVRRRVDADALAEVVAAATAAAVAASSAHRADAEDASLPAGPLEPPEPVSPAKEWAAAIALMTVFALICLAFVRMLRGG